MAKFYVAFYRTSEPARSNAGRSKTTLNNAVLQFVKKWITELIVRKKYRNPHLHVVVGEELSTEEIKYYVPQWANVGEPQRVIALGEGVFDVYFHSQEEMETFAAERGEPIHDDGRPLVIRMPAVDITLREVLEYGAEKLECQRDTNQFRDQRSYARVVQGPPVETPAQPIETPNPQTQGKGKGLYQPPTQPWGKGGPSQQPAWGGNLRRAKAGGVEARGMGRGKGKEREREKEEGKGPFLAQVPPPCLRLQELRARSPRPQHPGAPHRVHRGLGAKGRPLLLPHHLPLRGAMALVREGLRAAAVIAPPP